MRLLTLCAACCLCGCVVRLADVTVVSTKNVDLSRLGQFKKTTEKVKGSDSRPIIFLIPVGTPNVEEAIDRAIESVVGGVAITDGVFKNFWFYIPYVFGMNTYSVEGHVLYDPEVPDAGKIKEPPKPKTVAAPPNRAPGR